MRIKFFLFIFLITFMICCSTDYREANHRAVEKLHTQIIEGKYEEIYDQSSNIVKSIVSRTEFVNRMKIAVKEMQDIDESLNWHRSESEENYYNDFPISENSVKKLEKNGKSMGVFIYWTDYFTLCGFEINSSDIESEVRVVQARS